MNEEYELLPLGSVVSLKGNEQPLMIIGRALIRRDEEGDPQYFDYSFCLYPAGLIGDAVAFSNHDCIETVHFEGYRDEADKEYTAHMMELIRAVDLPKCQPKPVGEW